MDRLAEVSSIRTINSKVIIREDLLTRLLGCSLEFAFPNMIDETFNISLENDFLSHSLTGKRYLLCVTIIHSWLMR